MQILSQCIQCKNFKNNGGYTCKAFTKGIPDEVVFNDIGHIVPIQGQENDIIFQPRQTTETLFEPIQE